MGHRPTRRCLNAETNPGQPPGCSERHTCIRIAPYDRVHAERPVRYRPYIFHDCPGRGGVRVSQGKHTLLHQSDMRSRAITRTSHRSVPCQAVRSGGFSALMIATSSGAITFVLLAGFAAGSPSPTTETSIRTSPGAQGDITRCTGQRARQRQAIAARNISACQDEAIFRNPSSAAWLAAAPQHRQSRPASRGPLPRERRLPDA
jgi:hypothetical protein